VSCDGKWNTTSRKRLGLLLKRRYVRGNNRDIRFYDIDADENRVKDREDRQKHLVCVCVCVCVCVGMIGRKGEHRERVYLAFMLSCTNLSLHFGF